MRAEAEKSIQAAKVLARDADPASIYAMRVADAARRAEEKAVQSARHIEKTRPKGIRTVRKWANIDADGRRLALHWIARNARDGMTECIDSYVARSFRSKDIDGVKVWDERQAY